MKNFEEKDLDALPPEMRSVAAPQDGHRVELWMNKDTARNGMWSQPAAMLVFGAPNPGYTKDKGPVFTIVANNQTKTRSRDAQITLKPEAAKALYESLGEFIKSL